MIGKKRGIRPFRAVPKGSRLSSLPIVRGAHVIVLQRALRELGVPVDRAMAQCGLPPIADLAPDDYVSVHAAFKWAARCSRDLDASELGFMGATRSSLSTFSAGLQRAVLNAVNGRMRLDAFLRLVPTEQSALSVQVWQEPHGLRVVCDLEPFRGHPVLVASEWLQVHAIISIVRSVAGRGWTPPEITFVSRDKPSYAALDEYGNTHILCGQPHTSVLVPELQLSSPCNPWDVRAATGDTAIDPEALNIEALDFEGSLRLLIRPYLGAGCPGIGEAAELAGMSPRSLQRKLAEHGRSYSRVVRDARYEVACGLLADPAVKIIDVAFAAGYEHPQHFARAFRQVAGVSPRAYRRQLLEPG
jgi:AraC-like DNA-binding protein